MKDHVLYSLFKSNIPSESKLWLYKSYIRPLFAYASTAWSRIASSHHLQLQRFQSKILKIIYSALFRYSTSELHFIANIPLFKDFSNITNHKFLKLILHSLERSQKNIHVQIIKHPFANSFIFSLMQISDNLIQLNYLPHQATRDSNTSVILSLIINPCCYLPNIT